MNRSQLVCNVAALCGGTFQDSNHAEPCGGLGVGVSIEDRGVDVYARVSGAGCGSYMMSRGTEEARLWLVCLSRW